MKLSIAGSPLPNIPWQPRKEAPLCTEAPYELTGFVPGVCFPVGCLCDSATGRIAIYSHWVQYPGACSGLDVAAVVTPLASRLTTAATKWELAWLCGIGVLIKCLGACPENYYGAADTFSALCFCDAEEIVQFVKANSL